MTNASDDLTNKRIASKWRAFFAELEGIYERRLNPKPGFWSTYEAEERALQEKLQRRPLPLAEMENAFALFRAKVLKAL
jgi:hypothetical protein